MYKKKNDFFHAVRINDPGQKLPFPFKNVEIVKSTNSDFELTANYDYTFAGLYSAAAQHLNAGDWLVMPTTTDKIYSVSNEEFEQCYFQHLN